ncbi:MAG: cupin domain-containing protein [Betaproteobacteria bacterium]|jgi:mannose-6-phosphate isomerase-like protein (cupin superfamily)
MKLIKLPQHVVQKPWGTEVWIHNSQDYCGKLLNFDKVGSRFSMHYHIKKRESWYVARGSFKMWYFNLEDAHLIETTLIEGDCVTIERGFPHQLEALEDNSCIFEVSTEHFDEDSYRLFRKNPNELFGEGLDETTSSPSS